jgi:hypothetical protein
MITKLKQLITGNQTNQAQNQNQVGSVIASNSTSLYGIQNQLNAAQYQASQMQNNMANQQAVSLSSISGTIIGSSGTQWSTSTYVPQGQAYGVGNSLVFNPADYAALIATQKEAYKKVFLLQPVKHREAYLDALRSDSVRQAIYTTAPPVGSNPGNPTLQEFEDWHFEALLEPLLDHE